MFTCQRCTNVLVIHTDEPVEPGDLATPERFITLTYGLSSTARWTCPDHGVIAPVTVAIVDDDVAFVPPE